MASQKDSDEHWTDQNGWINSKSYCSLLPLESDESRIFSANGKPWFGWIDQSDHLMNFLSMFLKKSNMEKECNQCITIKAKEIKALDSHWTADLYVDLISKTSSITHSQHTELISVNNAKNICQAGLNKFVTLFYCNFMWYFDVRIPGSK